MKAVSCAFVLATALWMAAPAFADAKPDPSIPTPEAQALIGQVKGAYTGLTSLRTVGKMQADLDVGGKTDNRGTDFTSAYTAPGVFRHEIKGELQAGSTGQKVYIYEEKPDRFISSDAPKEKESYRQLPGMMGQLLEVQDPSLLMAVSSNSISDLVDGAKSVRTIDATPLDGKQLPTLAFTAGDGRNVQLAFDSQSHLLRRATYDLAPMLRTRGAEQVNKATITIQYKDVQPNAKLAGDYFAWSPPESARDVSQGGDTLAIEGKPAPDFTLSDLDGKQVKLSSLKGSVVLLDFWATWCPPCVRLLPEVAALSVAKKGAGVKVFAVNVGEDKATVKRFLQSKNITVPVLLDEEEKTAEDWGIRYFPTTVIIRPDGVVAKAFVGLAPGGKAEIEHELDLAAGK